MTLQCAHRNVRRIVPNQGYFLPVVLWLCAAPAIAAPMSASGRIAPHDAVGAGLVVEHVDIVTGENDAPARAYLTIYNAEMSDKRITAIAADGFGPPVVRRRAEILSVPDAFLVIPRQAELFMAADSLFLEFFETEDVEGERMMSVTFDDGSVLTVPVTLHPPGGVRTAHHHGVGDFE